MAHLLRFQTSLQFRRELPKGRNKREISQETPPLKRVNQLIRQQEWQILEKWCRNQQHLQQPQDTVNNKIRNNKATQVCNLLQLKKVTHQARIITM